MLPLAFLAVFFAFPLSAILERGFSSGGGLSLPGGLDQAELPIGIQLLGADYSEQKLFQIGRAYEMATENETWRPVKPKVLR